MKRFTIDEANAMLPFLREDLRRLQEMTQDYENRFLDLQDRKASHTDSSESGDDLFFSEELRLDFARMEIRAAIRSFELKGVQLKMIDPGLLDFPARLGGEEVLLCWKEGESQVSHYHGWQDGFAGRRPLPGETDEDTD